MGFFTYLFTKNEKKTRFQEMFNRGNYLASLISLYPTSDLKGDKRDFFLRTLTEYFTSEGLAYCVVHDQRGDEILSLVPHDLASKVPRDIQMKSRYAMGLTTQTYQLSGTRQAIHEFAKPVFQNGQRAGIVRLGFMTPASSILSMEHISYLGIFMLFVLAPIIILYYGAALVLNPIRDLYRSIGKTGNYLQLKPNELNVNAGLIPVIQDLEQSFISIKNKLGKTEADNIEMSTRLGLVAFEKRRIGKILNSMDTGLIIADIHENVININDYMLVLMT